MASTSRRNGAHETAGATGKPIHSPFRVLYGGAGVVGGDDHDSRWPGEGEAFHTLGFPISGIFGGRSLHWLVIMLWIFILLISLLSIGLNSAQKLPHFIKIKALET
jgi:hypothetical protein